MTIHLLQPYQNDFAAESLRRRRSATTNELLRTYNETWGPSVRLANARLIAHQTLIEKLAGRPSFTKNWLADLGLDRETTDHPYALAADDPFSRRIRLSDRVFRVASEWIALRHALGDIPLQEEDVSGWKGFKATSVDRGSASPGVAPRVHSRYCDVPSAAVAGSAKKPSTSNGARSILDDDGSGGDTDNGGDTVPWIMVNVHSARLGGPFSRTSHLSVPRFQKVHQPRRGRPSDAFIGCKQRGERYGVGLSSRWENLGDRAPWQ